MVGWMWSASKQERVFKEAIRRAIREIANGLGGEKAVSPIS
jgi:hypothetical protein